MGFPPVNRVGGSRYGWKTMADILIADDQSVTRQLLCAVLTRMGHHVTEACDGPEALELCRNMAFDLVILDYHMNLMNGLDVAEQLKGRVRFILYTSAHDNKAIRQKAFRLGALNVIGKAEGDFKNLQAEVNKLLKL